MTMSHILYTPLLSFSSTTHNRLPLMNLQDKRAGSLKEQLEAVGPQLEELREKKGERARQFVEVKGQIAKICGEIAGSVAGEFYPKGDQDLSLRRLEEYQAQLQSLQKEKVHIHLLVDCLEHHLVKPLLPQNLFIIDVFNFPRKF